MSDDTWAVTHANGRIYHDEYFRKYCTWCLEEQAMASVNDWAAKAAREICRVTDADEMAGVDRLAAIIVNAVEQWIITNVTSSEVPSDEGNDDALKYNLVQLLRHGHDYAPYNYECDQDAEIERWNRV